MDINPDQLCIATGLPPTSLIAKCLDKCNRLALHQSEGTITLDEEMASRLRSKLSPHRLLVQPLLPITATQNDKRLTPKEHNDSKSAEFARRNGFSNKFVVMYSGNHTHQHPLDTLLKTADKLADNEDFVFVFIGGGQTKHLVDSRVEAGQKNIISLPYQPLVDLRAALLAADLQTVIVGESSVGIVHPSKLYTALALPRPILLIAPARCPAREIVGRLQAGWTVDHDNVDDLIAVLKRVASIPKTERWLASESVSSLAARQYGRRTALNNLLNFLNLTKNLNR